MSEEQKLGSCCEAMREALESPPHPFFRTASNGVYVLSVGFNAKPEGVAWFDHPVYYCPFCGKKLQDRRYVKTILEEHPIED